MADAVIDIESLGGGGEPDAGADGAGEGDQGQQQQSQNDAAAQQRQADKEYRDWLKSRKEDGEDGKFYRRTKDNDARLQALLKLEPKGIDGVKAHYETLQGIAHGDKTGIEAVQSIQEALAESQTILDAIAQGNMDSLSDEQKDGIYRMAPAVIADLAETNPDAYAALLLPHFVEGLKGSALFTSLNGLLETLNQKPPSWLTKEQIPQWTLEHVQNVTGHAQKMAQWFQAQDERVKQLGGKDGSHQAPVDRSATQSGPVNKEFWQQSVYPQTNQHAEETFNKELRPWAEKLQKAGIRLSDAKKKALAQEMVETVSALAKKNPAYSSQMKRFNSQRSPDAASVISTFRSEFNRHAKTVLDGLIRRDYGQVLDKGTAKVAPKAAAPGTKTAPVAAGVKVVSVKPERSQIDFQRTPTDWIYQNKWRLKSGAVVQYRP
jgi:hypothetical protein